MGFLAFLRRAGGLGVLGAALGFDPVSAARPAATPEPVSFRREVMAVLSKSGCASGACHGNRNGKGGFKLSLRGQDPEADWQTLRTGVFGRRLDLNAPEDSLLLLKPTTGVAHEGGERLVKESPEYDLLLRWIAARAPDDPGSAPLTNLVVSPAAKDVYAPADRVPLRVIGEFADGRRRDVTRLAVYETSNLGVARITADGQVIRVQPGETTVMVRYLDRQAPAVVTFVPERPRALAGKRGRFPRPANAVDSIVFDKLKRLRLLPAPRCDDATFARRAYLDLLGVPPTVEEARAFVAGQSPDKRGHLVDSLLERPEFAEFWALKWADLLRLDERTLDKKGARQFYNWIRESIARHQPLDAFARDLVSAQGSTYSHPAANYYRNLRTPVERAEAAAQVWLGTRLQCAQCHQHPYERWTQDDYHDWTALFARVDYQVLENRRRDENDKHEFKGEQVIYVNSVGSHRNPRTGRPAEPRFLGTASAIGIRTNTLSAPTLRPGDPTNALAGPTELDALSQWLTRPEHPLFARVQANRIWYHLMGRGLVEPLDDFRLTNPASHPELLQDLAVELVASHYDLRHVIRRIMNSHTYQQSSEPASGSDEDVLNYSHTVVRRLTAEQLLDAQSQAAGVPLAFPGFPTGTRAGQMPLLFASFRASKPDPLDRFLRTFGKPPRQVPSECERTGEPAMTQAFALISGPTMQEFIGARDNRLATLLDSGGASSAMVDELYWAALSRPPAEAEASLLVANLEAANDRRAALEDLLWALLNSKEFVLRR